MRNYDRIARFYDGLSRIVFGRTLKNAQLYLLNAIPRNSSILIAGGGTGWILEEITRLHPSGLTITCLDISAKMIALSEKREIGNNKVTFITADACQVKLDGMFDVVLTSFLIDNLSEDNMEKVCTTFDAHLVKGGKWLYCDFCDTGKLRHKVLLMAMYTFFRLFAGIEATDLPGIDAWFSVHCFNITGQKTFMSGFVRAVIYEKRT